MGIGTAIKDIKYDIFTENILNYNPHKSKEIPRNRRIKNDWNQSLIIKPDHKPLDLKAITQKLKQTSYFVLKEKEKHIFNNKVNCSQ